LNDIIQSDPSLFGSVKKFDISENLNPAIIYLKYENVIYLATPALFTKIWKVPNLSTTYLNASVIEAGSDTSHL
jgi:hypothetical protein